VTIATNGRKCLLNLTDTHPITLIIPCRNEAGTIGLAIEKGAQLPGVKQIIVVEGNSNDKTHQVAKHHLAEMNTSLDKLLLIQNGKGKWDAVTLGINNANNPYISIWDADLTVSPDEQEMIHNIFYKELENQQDVFATGNRMADREPGAMKFFNVIGNYFFGYLWNFTAKQAINDSLCGSKIFKKTHLATLPDEIKKLDPYGDFSIIAAALASKVKTISVPITYRARTYGQTNIARWRGGYQLFRIWLRLHLFLRKKPR
jgi:glycosyltransferase involved in cell wall biosynthesis